MITSVITLSDVPCKQIQQYAQQQTTKFITRQYTRNMLSGAKSHDVDNGTIGWSTKKYLQANK